MNSKEEIIDRFRKNVLAKKADLSEYTQGHDGKEGHWLEKKMGVKPNSDNKPDLFGYEQKHGSSKTTYGDWSPAKAIWSTRGNEPAQAEVPQLDRDKQFLPIFGAITDPAKGRYSWCIPTSPRIDEYNHGGQILEINDTEDILIRYSYSKDQRQNKRVPDNLQREDLILALWERDHIRKKVEDKFNCNGWYKIDKNRQGKYTSIGFGEPFNYRQWLDLVRSGEAYFDSGMHQGNPRPYANWRSGNNVWDLLVTERYD